MSKRGFQYLFALLLLSLVSCSQGQSDMYDTNCYSCGVSSDLSAYETSMPYPKIFVHGLSGTCDDWNQVIDALKGDRFKQYCATVTGIHNTKPVAMISQNGSLALFQNLGSAFPTSVDKDSLWNFDYYYDENGYYSASGITEFATRLGTFIDKVDCAPSTRTIVH